MFFRTIASVCLFFTAQIYAEDTCFENFKRHETALKVLQIIEEQPDSIKNWVGDRLYISAERIAISEKGAFLCKKNSAIPLPMFAIDTKGVFVLCKKEDVNKEAQEHYDRAAEAFIQAIGHSIGAGISIEVPPVAVFEVYQATQAWKEAAREYNAGVESERGTYTPPEGQSCSERDHW